LIGLPLIKVARHEKNSMKKPIQTVLFAVFLPVLVSYWLVLLCERGLAYDAAT